MKPAQNKHKKKITRRKAHTNKHTQTTQHKGNRKVTFIKATAHKLNNKQYR
jgi:hypothetical protein